jgi:hypothetical protein
LVLECQIIKVVDLLLLLSSRYGDSEYLIISSLVTMDSGCLLSNWDLFLW